MCTTIHDKVHVSGSGKGPQGWFRVDQAYVGYDHPFHAQLEHAVNLDFVNEAADNRVAVELTIDSARELANQILRTIDQAEAYERGTTTAAEPQAAH